MKDKILNACKRFFLGIPGWLLNFFQTRSIGFYLILPAILVAIAEPIVYKTGFFSTEYESYTTYIIPFFLLPAFALAFVKPTARYAPMAIFALSLVGLLEFVRTTYMHLTTVFFGGITGNVFVQAGFPFSFCVLSLAICMLLSAVAMFFRQDRAVRGEALAAGAVKEAQNG